MKQQHYPKYVLAVLFLVYLVNFIDRQILSILIEPIKEDLGVSDSAMGFLAGIVFALFYSFAGIPIARLADRSNRVRLITLGLIVWSTLTAASGLVRSYWQLAAARVGVGIGEATCVPCSHSLISDYFPEGKRGTALGVFSVGAHAGVMGGFFLGGWINELYGWRLALVLVGAPGLLLALLARLTVREPIRGALDGVLSAGPPPTIREVFQILCKLKSFGHLAFGAAFSSFTGYALIIWSPVFLIRVFGMSTGEAGTWLGLLSGFGGIIGTLSGGFLADRLSRRTPRWYFWLPALSQLGGIPLAILFLFVPNPLGAFPFLALVQVLGAMWMGPVYAAAQGLVSPQMRATAAASLVLVINLIGLGTGPLLVGVTNDLLAPAFGGEAVRYSLTLALMGSLLSAILYWRGARRLCEFEPDSHPSQG